MMSFGKQQWNAQLLRVPTGHRNHLVSDKSTCSLAT